MMTTAIASGMKMNDGNVRDEDGDDKHKDDDNEENQWEEAD